MRIVACCEAAEASIPECFGAVLEKHLRAIKNREKARTSRCAWSLLERVLRKEGITGCSFVCFSESGKPYFADAELYFSISHSGNMCAVSVADVPTGVDVERYRDVYSLHLMERVLSAAEKKVFDGNFTKQWCHKECVAKLSGVGLDECPAKIDTLDSAYRFSDCCVTDSDGVRYHLSAVYLGETDPVKIFRF